ncbi:MAG: hypothetical protein R3A45_08650 [Bdellovibrionota bacterium]
MNKKVRSYITDPEYFLGSTLFKGRIHTIDVANHNLSKQEVDHDQKDQH